MLKSIHKSKIAAVIPIIILIMGLFGQNASARLLGLSPDKMVNCSDLIFVGTVTNKTESGNNVYTTVSVKRVIKGRTDKKSMTITTRKNIQHFEYKTLTPDKGTKVMLLMTKGTLTADFNNIAVVKNNRATLYNGVIYGCNFQTWRQKDYEREYDKLLFYNLLFTIAVIALPIIAVIIIAAVVYHIKKKKKIPVQENLEAESNEQA